MKFQILPITSQLKSNQLNQSNPPSSIGERRNYKTVDDRHLQLFKEIHSSLFGRLEREFFKCSCNHLIIEHEESDKCRRPSCKCTTFASKAKLPIPRSKIVNWKAIEIKMRPFMFMRKIC